MERKELEALFCGKIAMELKRFQQKTLRLSPEAVYAKAYQIDVMINIYEALLTMSQKISTAALKLLVTFPNLLVFFYFRWLKRQDSFASELTGTLDAAIEELQGTYEKLAQGERKESA